MITLLKEKEVEKAFIQNVNWCISRAIDEAKKHEGKTIKDVFYYVVDNVTYQTDAEGEQLLRSPKTFIENGLGDCKSMTLYMVAVAYWLGYQDIKIWFSNQDGGEAPTHVYCEIDGNICDCVTKVFNMLPPHKSKWSYKVESMKNYRIEGIRGHAQEQNPIMGYMNETPVGSIFTDILGGVLLGAGGSLSGQDMSVGTQQPVIIQQPQEKGIDTTTLLLILGGVGVGAYLLLSK